MLTVKQIAIATLQVLALLSLFAFALYLAESGVDFKWIGVGGLTMLIFGSACFRTKDSWGNPRYWVTVSGLFILHCVTVGLLQRNNPMLSGIAYGAIGTLEATSLFGLLLYLFGGPDGGRYW